MISVAGAIFAAEYLCRLLHCSLGVAHVRIGYPGAGLVRGDLHELVEGALAVLLGRRRAAPGDLELALGRLRRLDTGADHTDAAWQPHELHDAGHLQRLAIVNTCRSGRDFRPYARRSPRASDFWSWQAGLPPA